MDILNDLKNPSADYRPIPFWSFNDKLEPEMLTRQIQEMDKAGIGGFFMHARGGLRTEYMSEDWMNCIKACIDEGLKLGMNSWCYDENGWPSGFADGKVPEMGEEYHVKWLKIEETSREEALLAKKNRNTLGIYFMDRDGNEICSSIPIEQASSDGRYYIIKYESNPCYVDILNPKTVEAFIKVTHEKYYERFKEYFGNGIKGFFTDEPQYSRDQIPWSHILTDEIKNRFGYDITDYLPALFLECPGYEKIRYHFWSTVSHLYFTSFGEQIYKWCEEHNCQLTGHVMMEDSLLDQMKATAGTMPFYEYMHIPGMDWLGRKIESPIIPKQVSSVANQLGKKFVISETFALCGWNVSFEELKWIAEWQYVNGVNLMCQHLEGYTLRGLRKRDYPPSLFYQQSWWSEYKQFNDYFARLGMLLSSANAAADVLVLHPIKSAWIAYNSRNNDVLTMLDSDFRNISETLSGLHVDYHYGDETILKKYGSVEGASIRIGACSYKTVLLPSMISIDSSTVALLETFISNGGIVLAAGMFPEYCDGEKSSYLDRLKSRVILSKNADEIYSVLQNAGIPQLSVYTDAGPLRQIHYCERVLGEHKIFFLVNHSQAKADAKVTLFTEGTVRKLCLETAEFTDIEQSPENDGIHLDLSFEPMQSYVLVVDKNYQTTNKPGKKQKNDEILSLGTKWHIEKMGLNSMTLDYCYYSIDNGPWEGPIHTINLMDLLLKRRKECSVSLKFTFDLALDLSSLSEFYLVAEDAEDFKITVNGKEIAYRDIGWWKDSSFKKVDISGVLQNGENTVILSRSFFQSENVYHVLFGENILETERNKLTYDVELESIYLVGDFGIVSMSGYTYGERNAVFTDGPFKLTNKPTELTAGNFTEQGLCFFSEGITVTQQVQIENTDKRYLLDLGRPLAPMTKVYINDQPVKSFLWAPYQIDVTGYLKKGDNKISITLFASNRNLLGPHHNVVGESYSVGPSTFTATPGWSEQGFMNEMWRDSYCFVKFGIA